MLKISGKVSDIFYNFFREMSVFPVIKSNPGKTPRNLFYAVPVWFTHMYKKRKSFFIVTKPPRMVNCFLPPSWCLSFAERTNIISEWEFWLRKKETGRRWIQLLEKIKEDAELERKVQGKDEWSRLNLSWKTWFSAEQ